MRQALHWNYDYYRRQGSGAFVNDGFILKKHTSESSLSPLRDHTDTDKPTHLSAHCMDIIRQQLMCTVDLGVLGQIWLYPQSPRAFVDFNTNHKCRNFDDVRRWAEEHQLPSQGIPKDFLAPPKEGDRVYAEIP